MDLGILVLTAEGKVEFASVSALEMFACGSTDELQQRWTEVRRRHPALCGPPSPDGAHVEFAVPVGTATRALRCGRHPFGDALPGQREVVTVEDPAQLAARLTDLRLATQLRVLARLAGTIGHDVKGPLNSMVINLELLQDTLSNGEDSAERQRAYLGVLKSEISRINQLVDTLVNQTGYDDDIRDVDLRDLIAELQTLLAPQAKLQHVACHFQVPEVPVLCRGHRVHLKQALLNIGVNALEAMLAGGVITIQLEVRARHGMVSVCDTGPGIPPEVLEKLGRLHSSVTTTRTGIGVYVARWIVETHSGTLGIDSQLGHGTCVRISLPLIQEP